MNESSPEQPNSQLDPLTGSFAEREKSTVVMFGLMAERIAGKSLRLDATFHEIEDLGNGELVRSPIAISGEVLEYDIDVDGSPALKVLVWEESFTANELSFEPPADFMQDEPDELRRYSEWHNSERVSMEPAELIRQIKYGNIEGLILSTRRV